MKAICIGMLMALLACHEEPTIVIKFEPNDLAQRASTDAGAAPKQVARDAGAADAGAKLVVVKGAACKTAADCVAVKADCCDCNNGGSQRAVGKSEAAKLDKALKAKCKGMMCATMISNDPSCGKKADCVAGACALR